MPIQDGDSMDQILGKFNCYNDYNPKVMNALKDTFRAVPSVRMLKLQVESELRQRINNHIPETSHVIANTAAHTFLNWCTDPNGGNITFKQSPTTEQDDDICWSRVPSRDEYSGDFNISSFASSSRDHLLYLEGRHNSIIVNNGVESLLIFATLTLSFDGNLDDPSAAIRHIPILGQKFGSGKTAVSTTFMRVCNLYHHVMGDGLFLKTVFYLRRVAKEMNGAHELLFKPSALHHWIHAQLTGKLDTHPSIDKEIQAESIFAKEAGVDASILNFLKNTSVLYCSLKNTIENKCQMRKSLLRSLENQVNEDKRTSGSVHEWAICVIDEFPNTCDNLTLDLNSFRDSIHGYRYPHVVLVGRGLHALSNFSRPDTGGRCRLTSINLQPLGCMQTQLLMTKCSNSDKYPELQSWKFAQKLFEWTGGVPLLLSCLVRQNAFELLVELYHSPNDDLLHSLIQHIQSLFDGKEFRNMLDFGDITVSRLFPKDVLNRLVIRLTEDSEHLHSLFSKVLLLSLSGHSAPVSCKVYRYLPQKSLLRICLQNRGNVSSNIAEATLQSFLPLFPTYTSSKSAQSDIIIPPLVPLVLDTEKMDNSFAFLSSMDPNNSHFGSLHCDQLEDLSMAMFSCLLSFHFNMGFIPKMIERCRKEEQKRTSATTTSCPNTSYGGQRAASSLGKLSTPNQLHIFDVACHSLTKFDQNKQDAELEENLSHIIPDLPHPHNPRTVMESNGARSKIRENADYAEKILQLFYELNKRWISSLPSKAAPFLLSSSGLTVKPAPATASPDSIFMHLVAEKKKTVSGDTPIEITFILLSVQDKWGKQNTTSSEKCIGSEFSKASMFVLQAGILKEQLVAHFQNQLTFKVRHSFFIVHPLTPVSSKHLFFFKDAHFEKEKVSKNHTLSDYINLFRECVRCDKQFPLDEIDIQEFMLILDLEVIDALFGKGFQSAMTMIREQAKKKGTQQQECNIGEKHDRYFPQRDPRRIWYFEAKENMCLGMVRQVLNAQQEHPKVALNSTSCIWISPKGCEPHNHLISKRNTETETPQSRSAK